MDDKKKEKIIFFGNGPLAEYALAILAEKCQILFRARERDDLEVVKKLKKDNPDAHGILASFGVMIKDDVLEIFEPEGILNIHPSLLPLYRGASPIESAILAGDKAFSVSVMKLASGMDAGPIYYQKTLHNLPFCKNDIYKALAECGAKWISDHLTNLPEPVLQDDVKATFTKKLSKTMSKLRPEKRTADELYRKVVAFQGFPKPKYEFYGVNCIILEAKVLKNGEEADLVIPCYDGSRLGVYRLQPEGRKPMDAKAFINGYKK